MTFLFVRRGEGGGSFENKENRTKLLKGYEIFPAELTCISSILKKFLKTVFGGTNIVWKFRWKLKSFEKIFVWGVRTFLQLSEKSSHSPLYKMEVPLRHCVILSIISVIPYFNGWNYLQNMFSSDTVTAVTSSFCYSYDWILITLFISVDDSTNKTLNNRLCVNMLLVSGYAGTGYSLSLLYLCWFCAHAYK